MKFRDAYIYVRLRNREDTYQRRDYGKCEIDVTIQRWLMIIYLPIDRIIVFRQMDQRQAISINHNFLFFSFFLFFFTYFIEQPSEYTTTNSRQRSISYV